MTKQHKFAVGPTRGYDDPRKENSCVSSDGCSKSDARRRQQRGKLPSVVSNPMKRGGDEWSENIAKAPAMLLRKWYPREANTHRSMKQRAKTKGLEVHPEFQEFKSFLVVMGPAPARHATLDRIDPYDPEYGPGKVRWADKVTQANNKTNTILIHDGENGETWTIARLAKKRGVSQGALRKQRARGASDHELIHGKPASTKPPTSGPIERPSPRDRFAAIRSLDPTDEELALMEDFLRRRRGAFDDVQASRRARIAEYRRSYELERGNMGPADGEPLPATFDDFIEDEEFAAYYPGKEDPEILEGYRRRFDAKWGHDWRTEFRYCDVRFDNLLPRQIDQIRRVDPAWVEEQEAKRKLRLELRESL